MKKLCVFVFVFALAMLCLVFTRTKAHFGVFAAETKKFAEGYIVVERTTGRVLNAGDEHKKLPMASTTKIITCILTMLNQPDLDKIVCIPKEACGIEGSKIFLKEGEHLSVRELLLGLMLSSGNDAAVALALDTFGSLENFQAKANAFCKELGAENTNIVTPNGLHDKDHYTTAADLAKITCFALENDTFREIVLKQSAKISNEFGKNERVLKNKNKMLSDYAGATGVKTGYTKAARRCLVSSAMRDGMELVCVVLGCDDWFAQSARLLDDAFSKYSMYELLPEHYHVGKFECRYGDKEEINLVCKRGFCYPLSESERLKIRKQVELPTTIKAPVAKEDPLGKIEFYLENELIFSEKIYSIDDSISMRVGDIFRRLWSDLLILG